jgi:hypothetical protein
MACQKFLCPTLEHLQKGMIDRVEADQRVGEALKARERIRAELPASEAVASAMRDWKSGHERWLKTAKSPLSFLDGDTQHPA